MVAIFISQLGSSVNIHQLFTDTEVNNCFSSRFDQSALKALFAKVAYTKG